MNVRSPAIRTQRGLTLIELMVSVTIGLMLLMGTASLFISNKRIYREQEELSRLQDNARFAMDTIITDLRMSRYAGCSNNFDAVENDIDGANDDDFLMSFVNGLEGSENGNPWEPSDAAIGVVTVANTDAIIIRYLEPTGFNLSADMANESDPVTMSGSTEIKKGDLVAVTDCESSDIVEATNVTSGGGVDTIFHGIGAGTPDSPGNADDVLSKRYDEDGELARFYARRYYIGNGDDGPALMMVQNYDDPLELAEGVENMQILYGEDTTNDEVADAYVDASTVTNWDDVVSVRIALLMRTVDEGQHNALDTDTYDLLGDPLDAGDDFDPVDDKRRRRIFSTTVQIRNRLL